MAPNRRAKNDHHGGGNGPANHHNQHNRNGNNQGQGGMNMMPIKCVRPKGCLDPKHLIYMDDINNGTIEVVRVTCNNMQCEQGNYMHSECFIDWEESVLNFLSSTGRARSWSVKQRQQNLWTKKGYDLAFKACDCPCGKGHLRKDLDWISPKERLDRNRINHAPAVAAPVAEPAVAEDAQEPPAQVQEEVAIVEENQQAAQIQNIAVAPAAPAEEKKKKKRKSKENLPTLSLSAPVHHPNDNHVRKLTASAPKTVANANSEVPAPNVSPVSSGIGSFDSDHSSSPTTSSGHWNVPESSLYRQRLNSLASNSSGSSGHFSGTGSPPSPEAQFGSPVTTGSILAQNIFKFQRKNSNASTSGGDRIRHNSTGSVFCRRNDFSSFNFLPKRMQNSYHIKMDDDGQGNDDLRFVVLATLQNQRLTKVNCCMCQTGLVIYDRYPLIDGTFFVSPRKYFRDSILMNSSSPGAEGPVANSPRYMSTICMHCLSGKNGGFVCRGCGKAWDGTTIVLGGCYNYDIFAASTCCARKVQCGNCRLVPTDKAPQFFSDASRLTRCYRCGFTDFHFAKALDTAYERYPPDQFQKILHNQKMEESLRVIQADMNNM